MKGSKIFKINPINESLKHKCYRDVYNYLNTNSLDGIFTINDEELENISSCVNYTKGTVETSIALLTRHEYLELISKDILTKYKGFIPGSAEYGYRVNISRRYGITPEEYEYIYTLYNGKCGICNRKSEEVGKRRLSVDHCHKTGKIRGLLCDQCNKGIGMFSEDIGRLKAAITYLESK